MLRSTDVPALPGGFGVVELRPSGVSKERIAELLTNREVLKTEVVRCFKQIAGLDTSIDIIGLVHFRDALSRQIQVPQGCFGDLETEYVRFDFDGTGRLHFNEAYKLVKHHLWAYLKKLGGVVPVDIPFKTLDQAGYRVSQTLGSGNQAVAMLAVDSGGQERCIKFYQKGKMSCGGITELKEEFATMHKLSTKRIAHAYEIFQDHQFYYMVNEAYRGGDLAELRPRALQQRINMDEEFWKDIFLQCFKALSFMHENAMMHCDIKEQNIMLKTIDLDSPEIVLIDFGLARAMAAEDGNIGGTPGYMPPEVFQSGKHFPGGDCFSMGVTMMQLVLDQVPDPKLPAHENRGIFVQGCMTLDDIIRTTATRAPPFHLLPTDMPLMRQLIERLLQKQMQLRPRAPNVLDDIWFTGGRISLPPQPTHPLCTMGITQQMFDSVR